MIGKQALKKDHGGAQVMTNFRQCMTMCFLLLSTSLVGCFGSLDEVLPEKKGIPGGLALACLRDQKFTKLVIEIQYEAGYIPAQSSLDLLSTRLESVCDKPLGIKFEKSEVEFNHEGEWNAEDVRDIGWSTKQNTPQMGDTLTWFVMFPAGLYEDSSVLGVAVDASTIAIFGDSIDEAEGPFGRPSSEEVENSVLVHEVGHLLGLVNLVYTSPSNHEDADHEGHSNNQDSVMYWAIESTRLRNVIFGTLPNDFDSDDRMDLAGLKDGSIQANDQLWS